MLTPFDFVPRAGTPDRAARLLTAVIGIVLVTIVCVVMRPAGTLAALVVLYLVGLAIVLKAMVPPAA